MSIKALFSSFHDVSSSQVTYEISVNKKGCLFPRRSTLEPKIQQKRHISHILEGIIPAWHLSFSEMCIHFTTKRLEFTCNIDKVLNNCPYIQMKMQKLMLDLKDLRNLFTD